MMVEVKRLVLQVNFENRLQKKTVPVATTLGKHEPRQFVFYVERNPTEKVDNLIFDIFVDYIQPAAQDITTKYF